MKFKFERESIILCIKTKQKNYRYIYHVKSQFIITMLTATLSACVGVCILPAH